MIRAHIARVVPGCESYQVSVDRPGGFVMPHPPQALPYRCEEYGDFVHRMRRITAMALNLEPEWRHNGPQLTTGYQPRRRARPPIRSAGS